MDASLINSGEDVSEQEKYLDTVVDSILKKQNKNKHDVGESPTYGLVYSHIKEVIEELDTSIVQCKKYNEAKIHRKYEIQIADLKNEISILENKVREQQNARNPSKKYVEDLVDQLVKYKNSNEHLKARVNALQKTNQELQSKIDYLTTDKSANGFFNQEHAANPNEQQAESFNLVEQVNSYLSRKYKLRKFDCSPKSSFEIYLKKNKEKFTNWTISDFIKNIDEWSLDLQRIRNEHNPERLQQHIISAFKEHKNRKLPRIATPISKPFSNFPYHMESLNSINSQRSKVASQQTKKHHSTLEVVKKRYVLK